MNEPTPERRQADGPPIPEVRDGLLSADDLSHLIADIAACTTLLSVQEKGGARQHAGAGPDSLETARTRLVAGDVRAVQLRYHFDGFEWSDTLMRMPTGFRLVRCQHPR